MIRRAPTPPKSSSARASRPGSRRSIDRGGAVDLSVIIPTLNEAAALPALLRQLDGQQGLAIEVIVADGGSADATQVLAQQAGARVVAAPRGRGAQMNAGAALARAPWLLFLHADSGFTAPDQLALALAAMQDGAGRNLAGHFALRFERTQPGHELFYRYLEAKTRTQRRYTINGDQGLLLSAQYFRRLGGYETSLPILEDQRIAQRIFEGGEFVLLPGVLTTSARRFEREGARARYTLMAIIMGLHAAGAREFFERAPQVYASADQSAPLDLRPFLQLAREILRQRGRRRTLLAIGAFVRENAWQLALRHDLVNRGGGTRTLEFYDRRLAPLLDHAAADAAAALLLAGWFYLWLPWQFRSGT